jgi:hypothetical protein
MFTCQHCQRQTEPGEKARTIVVETRPHHHPSRSYFMRGETKPRIDRGGTGTQIVREVRVCGACAQGNSLQ